MADDKYTELRQMAQQRTDLINIMLNTETYPSETETRMLDFLDGEIKSRLAAAIKEKPSSTLPH